jgi:hypothetical protein
VCLDVAWSTLGACLEVRVAWLDDFTGGIEQAYDPFRCDANELYWGPKEVTGG